jgi:hypothetical protein
MVLRALEAGRVVVTSPEGACAFQVGKVVRVILDAAAGHAFSIRSGQAVAKSMISD